ncbi:trypsin-like peptidase domain-containing protein [Paenibacillus caseinilyticus]|uniref:trypsin-like peptidase domain-containing protein n=1 Tax=Paenibacillus caseinilyticus TaxID=3098138 RepID=UPI0022B89862|nr:trypsin-like peptidase domain-containing protein [Paenibacillus caseinilyticus]MCZ8519947.1 trypsin-like peptidase domain-containing protein [Paenibacillus caseinilyticus]
MKTTRRWGTKVIKAATAAVLLVTLAGPTVVFADSAAAGNSSNAAVIQKTTSSVVAIIGRPGEDKKVESRYQLAHGTGVIVRSEGYILTNAHVVKDMHNITVVTSDGKSYAGRTTHYDEESDLALVKIEAAGLTPATFASPSDIQVGEPVMAIGTPLSFALRNSVTSGIVSGMERSVQSSYSLIQTDAAINPGNSGGALVNMKGQVIGINTLKFVEQGVDSLGFAIPVDTVQHVLDHFFKYGKVKRPYLGLELSESWEAVVGIPSGSGLEVTYVEADSPAAKAGVKKGDIVQSIGQTGVHTLVSYNEALKKYLPEEKVNIVLLSGGQSKTVEVVLGEVKSADVKLVQDAAGSYIDSDQGKTRIGDSHYGWSMKYPAGLIQMNQFGGKGAVTFRDAKEEYAISINVEEDQSKELSPYALLRKLDGKSQTVLEKRYVEDGTQPYAKLVGKTKGDYYYQARAFHKGDKVYYLTLVVQNETNYQNNAKRSLYEDLLDTFTLSFDAGDKTLKDISSYQDKNTIATEYGLSFDIPADWEDGYGEGLSYYHEESGVDFAVRISSASSGDTVKAWAARDEESFKASYVEDYRQVEAPVETTVDGVPALEQKFAYTMGDEWEHARVLYILKDKYKYELQFNYAEGKDGAETAQKTIDSLIASVHFPKNGMNASIGFIQDENELLKDSDTVTVTNEKYGYSIIVPEAWNSFDPEDLEDYYSAYSSLMARSRSFYFNGGSIKLSADENGSLSDTVGAIEAEHKKNHEIDADYVYTLTDEPLLGLTVKKFALQYVSSDIPYTLNQYVFEKNGIVYTMEVRVNDAVKTDALWQRIGQVVGSVTFQDPK